MRVNPELKAYLDQAPPRGKLPPTIAQLYSGAVIWDIFGWFFFGLMAVVPLAEPMDPSVYLSGVVAGTVFGGPLVAAGVRQRQRIKRLFRRGRVDPAYILSEQPTRERAKDSIVIGIDVDESVRRFELASSIAALRQLGVGEHDEIALVHRPGKPYAVAVIGSMLIPAKGE